MAFSDDEKPEAPSAGSKVGLVRLSDPIYCKTEASLAEEEMTVMLEIRATSSAAVTREGLDLVVVVDVSSSMEGHKMQSAKAALEFVIKKLTELDRLSVVTFNSSAQVLSRLRCMTEAAKEELLGKVGNLTANGRTDINSGLVKGLEVLARRVHTKSRTGNIYLMSDGKNHGPSSGDARRVEPGDVVVYTFGFGAGTDHELLAQLAKKSTGGTYSSVPDEANLSTSFALLLGGLLTVVAQDVVLSLNSNNYLKDVASMTVADGSDYMASMDGTTRPITRISFGNLFSEEVRTVLVHFKLKKSPHGESRAYRATLAMAQLSYAGQEGSQDTKFVYVKRSQKPAPPDSAGAGCKRLEAERIRREHAEKIKKVDEMARDKRMYNATGKARAAVLKEMEDIERIQLDDGDRMINGLRAELQQFLGHLDTQESYDELGHSFAISVIISHRRQRAAASGNDVVVTNIYVTRVMESCVDQAMAFEENPTAHVPSAAEDARNEIICNPLAAVSAPIAFNLDEAIRALQAIHEMLADAKSVRCSVET